jgi:glycosyltransferase involved in cell wall biosynthesis
MNRGGRKSLQQARVAVVHDWLPVYAGAERVLEQILAVLPQADLFSLIEFLPPDQRDFLGGRAVKTSFIQRLPFARTRYRNYLPFAPLAVEQFDLREYDVVISSSYVVAKAVLTTPKQLHISYVHSPVRYAWDLYFQYLEEGGLKRGIRSLVARSILHYLRQYDVSTSNRVDQFIANSAFVADRIAKTYRRDSTVIHPPVDTESFALGTEKDDYYLTVSRLVPYKRIDIIAEAFARLPDRRLLIVGDGPEKERIRAKSGPNVTMLGYQSNEKVLRLMQRARAFVFAAEEDFGIVPCEALSTGTPVIGYGSGGLTETVVEGETGVFFYRQDPDEIMDAVLRFESDEASFHPETVRSSVMRFSEQRFRDAFESYVSTTFDEFQRGGLRTRTQVDLEAPHEFEAR